MRRVLLSVLVAGCSLAMNGCATAPVQSAPSTGGAVELEIALVVDRLFDAMREGNADAMAGLFHPDARLHSVGSANGQPTLRSDPIADFIRAVGTPRTQLWDERISGLEIRADGGLATAWMNYAFYIDQTRSHCGVNAVQFFRTPAGWQILQITDTRRPDGCDPAL